MDREDVTEQAGTNHISVCSSQDGRPQIVQLALATTATWIQPGTITGIGRVLVVRSPVAV